MLEDFCQINSSTDIKIRSNINNVYTNSDVQAQSVKDEDIIPPHNCEHLSLWYFWVWEVKKGKLWVVTHSQTSIQSLVKSLTDTFAGY
jgi:hypothetical protein